MEVTEVTYETINKRLGYDFKKTIKKYWENVNSEYDGSSPIQDLTHEEKEFIFKDYLKRKGVSL